MHKDNPFDLFAPLPSAFSFFSDDGFSDNESEAFLGSTRFFDQLDDQKIEGLSTLNMTLDGDSITNWNIGITEVDHGFNINNQSFFQQSEIDSFESFGCPRCFEKFNEPGLLMDHIKIHKDKLQQKLSEVESHLDIYLKAINGELNSATYELDFIKSSVANLAVCMEKLKSKKKDIKTLPIKKVFTKKGSAFSSFKCLHCGKRLANEQNLRTHMKKVHEIEGSGNVFASFKCSQCGKRLANKQNLERHIKDVHETNRCPHCTETFKEKEELEAHKIIHREKYKHWCEICNRGFYNFYSYSNHSKSKHENIKPYCCSTCKKRFVQRTDFERHLQVHNPNREKEFKCSECPKSYFYDDGLKKHMKRVHYQ